MTSSFSGLLPRAAPAVTSYAVATPQLFGTGVTSITAGVGITLSPNPIIATGTVSLAVPVTVAHGGTNLTAAPTNGQLLIGNGAGYTLAALIGTADQVLVTNGVGTITLSAPQSIGAGSSPTFTALTLAGLTANAFLYSGTAGLLTTTAAPTNGQLLVGSTGAAPVAAALTGTANRVTVTNGAGTITLSGPQDIALTSSVTFGSAVIGPATAQTNAGKLNITGTVNSAAGPFANFYTTTDANPLFQVLPLSHSNVLLLFDSYWNNGDLTVRSSNAAENYQISAGSGQFSILAAAGVTVGNAVSFTSALNITASTAAVTIPVSLALNANTASSFVYSDASKRLVTTAAPTNGQLLVGSTGAVPVAAALTGTANRVTVTNGAGTITLSGPQDLAAASSPSFTGLTVSGLAAKSFIFTGVGGLLSATAAPTNGQLLIGSTGNVPVAAAITGTTDQVIVTNGSGTITLSAPQSINTTSSPSFTGLTVSGLTAKSFIFTGVGGLLSATAAPTNGQLLIGSTGNVPVAAAITGTANQVIVTNGAGTITLSGPQSLGTASSPSFAGLTVSGLAANAFLYSGTAGLLATTAAPTNGQLLIGSTGAAPVAAAITGTASQVVVTNGAGTITLSLPQSIATTSAVQFGGLNIGPQAGLLNTAFFNFSGALNNAATSPVTNYYVAGTTRPIFQVLPLAVGDSELLWDASWNGTNYIADGSASNYLISNADGSDLVIDYSSGNAAGASITWTNGIRLNHTSGLVTVGSTAVSGNTAKAFLYSDANKLLATTAAPTNGQLLIGSTGNIPVAAALTGTANQVVVTNGAGTVTLSTPQSIGTASAVTFGSLTLATAGGTPGVMSTYETATGTLSTSGAFVGTNNVTYYATAVGKHVSVTMVALSQTLTATTLFISALPSRFRPNVDMSTVVPVTNNTANVAGVATCVAATGVTQVSPIVSASWTAGSGGWNTFSMTWTSV
jgi:hypothetical protein